mmetsp:Transcript_76810/g.136132  ORF Transcript_76810/g.136132 Transcript_76810/m.136132 type:complete len:206 (+) Transcript_76810:150-767(+)
MSGTGWTRTAPPKPKLAASAGGISAAGRAASAAAVPLVSYRDAAERAIVAQKHTDGEVAKMLQTRPDDLEALAPKSERLEGDEPIRRQHGKKAGARRGHQAAEAKREEPKCATLEPTRTDITRLVPGDVEPEQSEARSCEDQCRLILSSLSQALEKDVIDYLSGIWAEAEDTEEAREVLCETLEAHGIEPAELDGVVKQLADLKL